MPDSEGGGGFFDDIDYSHRPVKYPSDHPCGGCKYNMGDFCGYRIVGTDSCIKEESRRASRSITGMVGGYRHPFTGNWVHEHPIEGVVVNSTIVECRNCHKQRHAPTTARCPYCGMMAERFDASMRGEPEPAPETAPPIKSRWDKMQPRERP